MSKIHIEQVRESTAAPVVLSRPRCRATLAWRVQHLLRQLTVRSVARITAQAIMSGALIAGGIIVGTGPIGAGLAFMGVCFAFAEKDEQTKEEYRQAVIAHFETRGLIPPKWTIGGAK